MIYELYMASDFTEFTFPINSEKKRFEDICKNYIEEQKSAIEVWEKPIMLRGEPKKQSEFFEIEDSGMIAVNKDFFTFLGLEFNLDNIELLPIETDLGEYCLMNVLNVIECLDLRESEYTALPNGQISEYKILDFYLEKIKGHSIFKVPQLPYNTFVTSKLLDFCQGYEVLGLEFDYNVNFVWSPQT